MATASRDVSGSPTTASGRPKASRRRGAALEAAILKAAWDEVNAVGMAGLTMDGIAERAGTSKAVLYRRWPNRVALVIAAIRREGSFADEVPDSGSLREDVLLLLRRMSKRFAGAEREIVLGLLAEYFRSPEVAGYLRGQFFGAETMMSILERADGRGEVQLNRITSRVASLPVDLVRHELFRTQAPVPEETLEEIVDGVFLPLLHP
ncbi:TetR/AcrR family transcriptional regulator [Streptomyces sp. NL15-2K]|uniref:TetR/AcrR family transcriptional regulator n=1 Tax=Streptomyces sp. NL15-2K TaxID=376149 RepID=UPI000F56BBC9|nr:MULTISPECIES: TetR/AcrR family transcriptional regulator [Actinomycetes]WKX06034.1 TetR/AcrR family transcriptional regulator [Kutzneria buriramensis]GCB53294.1 tetR family transcriptional regulator [Streptomyces sp. NL15-2K]